MAFAFQIVGHKNSGKTLITNQLISLFSAQISVAAIKHDAHQGQMDKPGTDSDRFYQAGATSVVLDSKQGFFLHQRQCPPLAKEVKFLAKKGAELILIEGHKAAPYPKVILLEGNESRKDWQTAKEVWAFASLNPNPEADLIGAPKIITFLRKRIEKCLLE